jgi:hypothetical protein
LLPLSDAVVKLLSFTLPQLKDSQRDSQSLPPASQALSIPVIKMTNGKERKETDEHRFTSLLPTPITTGQEREKWSGRQDSNSEAGYDHQELATRDSQGDSQSARAPVDPELKRVIDAWQKLPISLRGAIMAIVDLNCPAI